MVQEEVKFYLKKIKKHMSIKSILGHFKPFKTNFFSLVGGGGSDQALPYPPPATTSTHHYQPSPTTSLPTMMGDGNDGCQWLVVVVGGSSL